jgi:glycosyltransferase involved in cell wall biosynthesis
MNAPPPTPELSVVLPARDEAATVGEIVAALRRLHPSAEILVVDDGSRDATGEVARRHGADRVLRHPVPLGNGAAVKSGIRAARGTWVAFLDADGQHDPADLARLLERTREGYALVVGARRPDAHANRARRLANLVYNRLAGWVSGQPIADLTSGFRVARREILGTLLPLLPNGFSYPTTTTMAFLRLGHPVAHLEVGVRSRQGPGPSHIRPLRDGGRFLLIILRIGTLYAPLKVFTPPALLLFLLGLGNYLYTFSTAHVLTPMTTVLWMAAILVFMLGLISEQITTLLYVILSRPPGGGFSYAGTAMPGETPDTEPPPPRR